MKFRPITILIALALAVLGLAGACGDDDDDGGGGNRGGALTVQEYADEFTDIFNTATSDVQDLSDDLDASGGLSATADIFDDAANDLDGLNAPTELNHVHGPFVDATNGLADAFRNLADAAGSDSEAEAGDALDTARAIWQSACQGVVVAAAALGATVDVDCITGG